MNAAPAIIHAKSFWRQPLQRYRLSLARPRSIRRVAGGWIEELAALHKAIVLCDRCLHKFRPKSFGYRLYREPTGLPYCTSNCDACRTKAVNCKTFLPEMHVFLNQRGYFNGSS